MPKRFINDSWTRKAAPFAAICVATAAFSIGVPSAVGTPDASNSDAKSLSFIVMTLGGQAGQVVWVRAKQSGGW